MMIFQITWCFIAENGTEFFMLDQCKCMFGFATPIAKRKLAQHSQYLQDMLSYTIISKVD